MLIFDGLQASPMLLAFACGLLGLAVGSFLNVVILRLPAMLEQDWKRECRSLLELPEERSPPLSLARPASHCPSCKTPLQAWHNIPVLSWLLLRGRCAHCQTRISVQYPLVEAAAAILAMVCAWRFGWSLPLAGALLLSWTLLTLAVIDLRTQLLPDNLTLPLLWLGLLFAFCNAYTDLASAVLGAVAGYLSLWSVYQAFRLLTGKEGMGFGDFKLLAALGAWLGWQSLPLIILLSSVVGAVVGIGLIVLRRQDSSVPIPFGPYLAAAGWLALIWGDVLVQTYTRSFMTP